MTTATCVIDFGQGSTVDEPFAVLELDESSNLDGEGTVKTSFAAGDTIWLLLHLQPGYSPSRVYQTDGQASLVQQVTRTRTEQGVVFGPGDEAADHELSYYPRGSVAASWQGNNMTLQPVEGRTISVVPEDRLARCDLSYEVNFWLLRFDPPALDLGEDETYSIDVKITVEAV